MAGVSSPGGYGFFSVLREDGRTRTRREDTVNTRAASLALVLAIVAVGGLTTRADAAGFPDKPVNLVVAFAAGGPTDVVTRVLADKLTERLGQPAVVLNKPGSGGLLGAEFVAKSKADGHTILVLSLSHLLRQAIDPKMPIDVLKDLEPISLYVGQPLVIVAKGDSKFKSIDELVDFGLKNPGKLSFGSAGIGTTGHFSGELIKVATKMKFKHVPFQGDAPTITALMGGHIDFLVTGTPAVAGKVAAGELRLLATLEEARISDFKDVPTMKEKGYPEAFMYSWFGFAAPAGTPKDVTAKLDAALGAAIKHPATQEAVKKMGFNSLYKPQADYGKFVRGEFERFNRVAKDENITIQ
jgi:tripartite-type tricarboxylate transporter receptor subunit TctC